MTIAESPHERPDATAETIGRSSPLGATVVDGGVNFSLFSRTADGRRAAVLRPRGRRHARPAWSGSIRSTNRTYHYWHVFVPGVRPGQLYGYRVDGPSDPASGLRFDPDQGPARPVRPGRGRPEGLRPRGRAAGRATTPRRR